MLSSRYDPECPILSSPDTLWPSRRGARSKYGLLANATVGECHAVPRRF